MLSTRLFTTTDYWRFRVWIDIVNMINWYAFHKNSILFCVSRLMNDCLAQSWLHRLDNCEQCNLKMNNLVIFSLNTVEKHCRKATTKSKLLIQYWIKILKIIFAPEVTFSCPMINSAAVLIMDCEVWILDSGRSFFFEKIKAKATKAFSHGNNMREVSK